MKSLLQQFPHRVTLEVNQSVKNDFSERVDNWVNFKPNIYANVLNVSGSESNDSDQTQNFVTVSVRIRKRAGVTDDLRVVHRQRVLRILAVLPAPDNQYIDIKCKEWTDERQWNKR